MADLDDVYPRNCGLEGPVELFESSAPASIDVRRAGDHYLVQRVPDADTEEVWAVDRCGEERALLRASAPDSSPRIGAAGDYVLSCDDATGATALLDPTGTEPPRPLFAAVESCRIVPLGQGLAAQEKHGKTVWFHPDPTDPHQTPVVVTSEARVADPAWIDCYGLELDCDSDHPFGVDVRMAGDELLVALEGGELLAFSPASQSSRILDPGPVFAMDVLADDRVVVERRPGPTLVIDRRTGDAVEFGIYSDVEPIRRLGDWLVQGSDLIPPSSESPTWTSFEAYHLPSGERTVIEGNEQWGPLVRLTADTMLADIDPFASIEESRYVVWPATGERRPVRFPGDVVWTIPGRDGAYAVERHDDGGALHRLDGPDSAARVLIEDAYFVLATTDDRVVFTHPHERGEPTRLSVMLPNERVVVLEAHALEAFGPTHETEPWPLDRDEVLYTVEDGDGWALRRTVLP